MSLRLAAQSLHRRALTRMDVLGLISIFVILLVVYFVVKRPHRQPPFMAPCAAHLKAIGIAMYTYANENNSLYWPIATHPPAVEDGKGLVTYAPGKIGSHRGNADDPLAGATTELDDEMSTTRNLWTLIRLKMATPELFICPATDDIANKDSSPEHYWDFRNWHEVSYGYQVPYGKRGQPSINRPCRMPLIADKGPFGANLEANTPNPGVPTVKLDSKYGKWKPWNSPNHDSKGQNVLFADGRVEWQPRPIVNPYGDNIYTRWSDATGSSKNDWLPCVQGIPPTSNETPFSNTDALIYP